MNGVFMVFSPFAGQEATPCFAPSPPPTPPSPHVMLWVTFGEEGYSTMLFLAV